MPALLALLLVLPIPHGRFGWPLAPPHGVVRSFAAPPSPYGPGHRGVDLLGVVGAPVFASGDGVVVFAGLLVDRSLVSLDHGSLRTTYEPVTPSVAVHQRVRRGEVIGTLAGGHPGCDSCLHWGARRGPEYLNPLRLVSPGRVRLLPVAP
ncbi:hypothetical protein Lesp02_35000 [Lentzea sp. NBRC 105346]|uniref:murein hydrolase activator EnvC family protein n=1 Tax=Lentzea sp. NBRC 105346 TaxID=3032205 RepID=UPI0024A498B2|nr:M23 family metallopeptidase [Lentzea sp. NBRC 105346]GLZ31312.1 hypothetical protein Lesp02_35000 [Lentzea sp. NBRC 105346]